MPQLPGNSLRAAPRRWFLRSLPIYTPEPGAWTRATNRTCREHRCNPAERRFHRSRLELSRHRAPWSCGSWCHCDVGLRAQETIAPDDSPLHCEHVATATIAATAASRADREFGGRLEHAGSKAASPGTTEKATVSKSPLQVLESLSLACLGKSPRESPNARGGFLESLLEFRHEERRLIVDSRMNIDDGVPQDLGFVLAESKQGTRLHDAHEPFGYDHRIAVAVGHIE